MTKIFHPNVSDRGEICVNTLKKDWKSDLVSGNPKKLPVSGSNSAQFRIDVLFDDQSAQIFAKLAQIYKLTTNKTLLLWLEVEQAFFRATWGAGVLSPNI